MCGQCELNKADEKPVCYSCSDEIDNGNSLTSPDGDVYCESCYSDTFCTCDKCSDTIRVDDSHNAAGHRRYSTLCESCHSDLYSRCDDCSESVLTDRTYTAGDSTICQGCYEDHYFTCNGCAECFHNDDMGASDDGCYCTSCTPDNDDSDYSDSFNAKRFRPYGNTFDRTSSTRRFGVELETSACPGYRGLRDAVHFGAKEDGSIDAMEFVSDILSGDKGLDAISDFCTRANDLDFKVDEKCGFHAHFDVGDLDVNQLKAVSIAYYLTYSVWSRFVSKERRANHYCAPTKWDSDDCQSWLDFLTFVNQKTHDRYAWFNVKAYADHGTLESRLHGGTLSADKIINWVVANLRFIDFVSKMSIRQVRETFQGKSDNAVFNVLADIWNDPKLTEYFLKRADKFGRTFSRTETEPATELQTI